MTLDMRLGAKDNSDSSWKEIARSTEQREYNCKQVLIDLCLEDRKFEITWYAVYHFSLLG